jgi:hypothetical protein
MAINTIGLFLNKITQNPNLRFYLLSAEMDVFLPTFLDEKLGLLIRYLKCEDDKYYFSMNVSFFISHEIFDFEIKTKCILL